MANYIATAATNGAVVLWNLSKKSLLKQGKHDFRRTHIGNSKRKFMRRVTSLYVYQKNVCLLSTLARSIVFVSIRPILIY
jgi:hypothetical protein